MARKAFRPTEEQRRLVAVISGYGFRQDDIATEVEFRSPTNRVVRSSSARLAASIISTSWSRALRSNPIGRRSSSPLPVVNWTLQVN